MNERKTFNESVSSWPLSGSGVHNYMMSISNIGAKEGINEQEIIRRIKDNMPRTPSPSNEVEQTVAKAFADAGKPYTKQVSVLTAQEKVKNKENIAKLKASNVKQFALFPSTFDDLIDSSPVNVTKGDNPVMAARLLLYLYGRKELVWCGTFYGKGEGINTVENWAEKFLCLEEPPPFIIPNPLTGEPSEKKSGGESYRCDASIADHRYALFEIDLKEIPLEWQCGFWMKMKDRLPLEAITYSGGKSLHALIRADCKNEMEWNNDVRSKAFPMWEKYGADMNCRNPSRLSRLPGHMRDGKTCQRLLWLRGGGK